MFSTIFDISDPILSFLRIFLKPFLEASSIDKGETARGSGFKFPLVISTSIKAKALIGIKNNIKPRNLKVIKPGGLGTYFIKTIMDSVKWNKNSKSFTNHLTMSKKVN